MENMEHGAFVCACMFCTHKNYTAKRQKKDIKFCGKRGKRSLIGFPVSLGVHV